MKPLLCGQQFFYDFNNDPESGLQFITKINLKFECFFSSHFPPKILVNVLRLFIIQLLFYVCTDSIIYLKVVVGFTDKKESCAFAPKDQHEIESNRQWQ